MPKSQNDTTETAYRIARHTEARVRTLVENLSAITGVILRGAAQATPARLEHGGPGSQHPR
jgi:hypothetical protein